MTARRGTRRPSRAALDAARAAQAPAPGRDAAADLLADAERAAQVAEVAQQVSLTLAEAEARGVPAVPLARALLEVAAERLAKAEGPARAASRCWAVAHGLERAGDDDGPGAR